MKWNRAALSALPVAGIAGLAAWDLTQKKHALLRNFPVLGHMRYLLEEIGPELRQYIVTSNDEERPFSRNQRRWIYASSKLQNNYYGFGTDNNMEYTQGYPIIKHRTFADISPGTGAHTGEEDSIPSAKILGGPRGRAKAFRPGSIVNISAMSFGSMSGAAIEAINRGAGLAGCLHNTGEGGLSPYHRQGGDLTLQIGTAYFGCRDDKGRFEIEKLKDVVASGPVKAIEIKLSQGAKPGLGGMLPGAKVSAEIAEIRGIPVGKDCASPSRHAEFHDVDSMLDWVELIATETGLPVGIKSAVGNLDFWHDLVAQMSSTDRGVDFITVDGGEGGTGAAPLIFSESVSFPFRVGFTEVYKCFARADLTDKVTFIGSGKLGLPGNAVVAFALGADMVNVGREIMLSIGCVQAQKCHTDTCPTGITTQNKWLARGLDAESKSVRAANYIKTLRRDLLKVSEACGVAHPGLICTDDLDILNGLESATSLRTVYGYEPDWGTPSAADKAEITRLMTSASHGKAAPVSATSM
ncbi:FMN-binding glutamate synthase family protein [Antrihabitans stalactiti]|uniref:FMN-binding glutamate synthase family protein n=1 Tax=Antrihabitans stalactiti TaxID=2584121 RepID=A0A848KE95_9NOCA|nr:FMN-binding glutamate synthase family protein [Antrihabitans stalactiti]NMN96619.1 FMN-binding glutamate synthase family protein [Antrihabitans stalactiti]